MKQSKAPAVGLPIMVDRNNKTDYYHDRTSLDACFKSGLLNKDHSHITLSDAKGWKLDVTGKGFVEFDPLADRGPEKYPGEHREYKFSEIMAELQRKAADPTKVTGPDNGKDYVWPYTFPHPLAVKKVQDGEITLPDIKQMRWKMTSTYPIRVSVTNVDSPVRYDLYTFRDEEQFSAWIESPVFDPKGYYTINGSNKVLAYEEGVLSKAFVNVGTHPTKLFPGDKLFQLKATHGIPLEISLENLTRASMVVEWELFIKEARKSGWYDFQTLEVIQNALADVFDRDYQEAIILRLKLYILKNPMTA